MLLRNDRAVLGLEFLNLTAWFTHRLTPESTCTQDHVLFLDLDSEWLGPGH